MYDGRTIVMVFNQKQFLKWNKIQPPLSKSDTKLNFSAWGSSNACWNYQKQVQPSRRHLEVIPLTSCKYCSFIRHNGAVHLHHILQTHCNHITWPTNNTNPLGDKLTYGKLFVTHGGGSMHFPGANKNELSYLGSSIHCSRNSFVTRQGY